jgi:ribosomal 30S subunit maturation factor RimM
MRLSIETGGDLQPHIQPPLPPKTYVGELVDIQQYAPDVFMISLQTGERERPIPFTLGPHLRITTETSL